MQKTPYKQWKDENWWTGGEEEEEAPSYQCHTCYHSHAVWK